MQVPPNIGPGSSRQGHAAPAPPSKNPEDMTEEERVQEYARKREEQFTSMRPGPYGQPPQQQAGPAPTQQVPAAATQGVVDLGDIDIPTSEDVGNFTRI